MTRATSKGAAPAKDKEATATDTMPTGDGRIGTLSLQVRDDHETHGGATVATVPVFGTSTRTLSVGSKDGTRSAVTRIPAQVCDLLGSVTFDLPPVLGPRDADGRPMVLQEARTVVVPFDVRPSDRKGVDVERFAFAKDVPVGDDRYYLQVTVAPVGKRAPVVGVECTLTNGVRAVVSKSAEEASVLGDLLASLDVE